MNSKHLFVGLSVFTLVSIAHGEREVFAPSKLAPVATGANGKLIFAADTPFYTGGNIYGANQIGIGTTGSNLLGFFTNATERMRIASDGQVYFGNGVTNATPNNGFLRATNGQGTNIGGANLSLYSGAGTGSADSGVLTFHTASPGASGSGLNSFSERMRITSNGNVFIGNGETAASTANGNINATGGSGTNIAGADLNLFGGRSTGNAIGGAVRLFTAPAGASGSSLNAAVERMRIDSAGNVGIGTTTNLSTLTINGPIAPKGPTDVNAATYTVATTDSSLRFTTTNCTVTLPTASSFPGRILWLNTVTANSVTSNASNVIPLGSNTAGTAIFAATAGKFAMIQSNGTNWVTMMSN